MFPRPVHSAKVTEARHSPGRTCSGKQDFRPARGAHSWTGTQIRPRSLGQQDEVGSGWLPGEQACLRGSQGRLSGLGAILVPWTSVSTFVTSLPPKKF